MPQLFGAAFNYQSNRKEYMSSVLTPFIEEVKKNPNQASSWFRLAQAALEIKDWRASLSAFLAGLKLEPNHPELLPQITAVQTSFIQSLNITSFGVEVVKMPLNTVMVVLVGNFNMEVDGLEQNIKTLLTKGTRHIILDFTGLTFISGLGPSTLKKINQWCGEKSCKVVCLNMSDNTKQTESIKQIFTLKDIKIPMFKNIPEALK